MMRFLCLRLVPRLNRSPSRHKQPEPDWLQLAIWCEQFCPLVGFDDALAPQSLLLDLSGMKRVWPNESTLVAAMLRKLDSVSLLMHLAVADSLGAAWGVARYGVAVNRRSQQRSQVLIVAPGETATRAALAPLPIAALRLDSEQLTWLDALGIERIEQLTALPRGALAERFGPSIVRRYDQALGRVPEPLIPYRAPPELCSERNFEFPLEQLDAILHFIGEQLAPLVQPLAQQRHGVLRLQGELHGEQAGKLSLLYRFSVGVFAATDRSEHLLELARLRLERTQLQGAVSKIRLVISATGPLDYRQGELFAANNEAATNLPLVQLIDRLSNRLGWEAVSRVRIVRDAQPELAWQREPWLDWFKRHAELPRTRRVAAPIGFHLPRPVRLLAHPAPLVVIRRNVEWPPKVFRWAGSELRVSHHWGPERIETGWWRGRNISRDYYLVETTTGSRAWLFQELKHERWFLHGWYD